MAVGKGSMARASKAAAKKTEQAVVMEQENVIENTTEVVGQKEEMKEAGKKNVAKKSGTKKTVSKNAVMKTEEIKEVSGVILEATSEQVMKQIVYQKSSQVLDRNAKVNETFGVGEAMPIYLF